MILYDVGKSIRKSDRNTLQELLDQFHSDDAEVTYKKHTCRLQALCTQVRDNATIYLTLDDGGEDLGQRYMTIAEVPEGTLLAVYFGSIERDEPGVMDSLNHSIALGKLVLPYVIPPNL